MLLDTLEAKIEYHIAKHRYFPDGNGKRIVVQNRSMPQRAILAGAGPITIKRPRVANRTAG